MTPVLLLNPGTHAAWEVSGTIEDVAAVAASGDRLGYEYMTCSEHVAIPLDRDGGFGPGQRPGGRYWDPLSTFGYLAARTTRIRFSTLVLVLSYHHPLDVVKRYGTLDHLSGGRLNLGVGVGYLKPEFDLLGCEFQNRNDRCDDAIRAIRASFGRMEPQYEGEFYSFSGLVVDPCGVQLDLPIWIGGRTRRSLRRAIELGDVWCPFFISTEEVHSFIEDARETQAWQGRQRPLDVAVTATLDPIGDPGGTASAVGDLLDAGATMLTLRFWHTSLNHYLEQMEAMVTLTSDRGLG